MLSQSGILGGHFVSALHKGETLKSEDWSETTE